MKNLLRISQIALFISLTASLLPAQWIRNGPSGGKVYSFAAIGTSLFVGTDGGVFRSTNDGGTWTAVHSISYQTVVPVTALATIGTNLLAGVMEGTEALYLSTDNGASWAQRPLFASVSYSIENFLIHGSSVFAATGYSGVFRSTDDGATWTRCSNISASKLAYVGSTLIASYSAPAGIYISRSTDNGNSWTPVTTSGLATTDVYALASNGTSLYAGTQDGVFLSTNLGTSWTALGSGMTNAIVQSFAFIGTSMFAASDKGVYRSSNNGANWTNVGLIPPASVQTLFTNGANLYAGGSDVFVSKNNGSSWANSGLSIKTLDVSALASRGTTLFAGTITDGVFASTDNGLNWASRNQGLVGSSIKALIVRGGSVLAATGSGVFVSSDDGRSWKKSDVGFTSKSVRTFFSRGATLFLGPGAGGVFRSTDDGATWTAANDGLGAVIENPVTGFAAIGKAFFASFITSASGEGIPGVYVSFDNGDRWVSTGLIKVDVGTLASIGRNLFAASDGVQRSTDNGTTWTSAGLAGQTVRSLVTIGVNLYAGTGDGDVFRSTDYGTSWTAITKDLPTNHDPKTGIFTLGVVGANLCASVVSKGLFLFSGCVSWADMNSDLINSSVVHTFAVNGRILYAGTGNGGVFRSVDAGVNWQAVTAGLGKSDVLALATAGENLFAGTNGEGVYRSTNSGSTWSKATTGLANNEVRALTVGLAGDHALDIIAGTWGGGVFVSRDSGGSWAASNIGLINSYVNAVAVSPTGTGQNLFAGTNGGGVFLSRDNGKSWSPVNIGLLNNYVYALAANGTSLFAGTAEGVFVSTNNGVSWTASNTGITNTDIRSLLSSGTSLVAGTNGGGVFLSANNGKNWTPAEEGLANKYVTATAFVPGALMAGTWGSGVFRWDGLGSIDATISPAATGPVLADQPFWVEIDVGDPLPVSDLYTVSFTLKSSQANCRYIDGSASVGALFGENATNVFRKIDAQTVSMQITMATVPGVNGTGDVAKAQFVSSSNSSFGVAFTLSDVVATGSTGTIIQLSPSTLVVQASSTLSVWPGDCNNDGTVSASDVLPIGLYYGQSYGNQNGFGSQWQAYTRQGWLNDTPPKMIYADANGDGVINTADLLSIGLNYGKTHQVIVNSVKEPVQRATALQKNHTAGLQIASVSRRLSDENRLYVSLVLNATKPVYGIAFNVKYGIEGSSENLVQGVGLDTTKSVFGGGLMLYRTSNGQGACDIGITRMNGIDFQGTGELMDLVLDVPAGKESMLRLEVCNISGNDAKGSAVDIAGSVYSLGVTGVEERIPTQYSLQQNYPNPFNPSTTIELSVPEQAHVVMRVYDVLGREVVTLLEGTRAPGLHRVSWDGKDAGGVSVRSGVYYCRMTAQGTSGKIFTQTRQMVVVK